MIFASNVVNLDSKPDGFLKKLPFLQWRAVHFTLKSAMVSYLNHTRC